MTRAILKYWRDERGATAIEYGLIVAAVGASLAALIFLFGDTIAATFQSILDVLAA
jgi:pilus assembly protein Flp/PilA